MFHVESLMNDIDTSYALVELDGMNPNGSIVNIVSDTTYELISGKVLFSVNGVVRALTEPGETFTAKHRDRYTDYGVMAIMLATSHPGFHPDDVRPARKV
jgi:hypothetical protein